MQVVVYGSISPGQEFALIFVLYLVFWLLAATKRRELVLISQLFLNILVHSGILGFLS